MTDRNLPHVGDDHAFASRLNDATHALQRLPSRHDNARLLAAIQLTTLRFLLGATDSATGQGTHTNERADRCTAACGACGCHRLWPQRSIDTRTGEKQDAGGAAAGRG